MKYLKNNINWEKIDNNNYLTNPNEASWLKDKGSLTKKMEIIGTVTVRVMQELWREKQEQQLWHREVLMLIDNQPWLLAVTQIPESIINKLPFQINNIGQQPIGKFLFNDSSIKLQDMLISRIHNDTEINQDIASATNIKISNSIWSRKRIFSAYSAQITIVEFFLNQEHLTDISCS